MTLTTLLKILKMHNCGERHVTVETEVLGQFIKYQKVYLVIKFKLLPSMMVLLGSVLQRVWLISPFPVKLNKII